jgi:hypothetical protein
VVLVLVLQMLAFLVVAAVIPLLLVRLLPKTPRVLALIR